jgi:hypothetical protein
MISSGVRTGLLSRAACSRRTTARIWEWLVMFSPKKMTPAAWPWRMRASSDAGGLTPG